MSYVRPIVPDETARPAPDLVDRQFTAYHATVLAAAPEWYPMGGRVFLKMDPGPRRR